jgi:uncharacterized protein
MKSRMKRIGLLVVGWAFIVLGIAGLFLPFLQGVLFLLIGLFILSGEYVWAHKLLHRLKERFPKIAGRFEHGRHRAEAWMSGTFRGKNVVKGDGAAD